MKKTQIILMAVLMAAGAGYSALLLDVNFESGTNGFAPAADYVRPSPNNTTQAVQVVNSTLLGGSKAVQFLDVSTQPTATSLQYNFASNGAVVASFSFSPSYTNGTSGNYIEFGLSQQVNVSSAANMFGGVRLRADGRVGFVTNGASAYTSAGLAVGSSNTISIVANDTASDIVYLGATVLANTASYYLNGSLVYSNAVFGSAATALGTTNGIGRVAMFDSTARVDLNYLIDNITVEAIPEPATMGMLLLGAVTVLAVRRRRA